MFVCPDFVCVFADVVLERLRAAHDGRREARPGTRWEGTRGSAWDAVLRTSVVRLFAPENSVTTTASAAGGLCDFAEIGGRLVAA